MFRSRRFLALALAVCGPVLLVRADNPPATDSLGRDTPRDAVRNMLLACHDNKFVRAAQYLDLSGLRDIDRVTRGPELARHLCQFLDDDQDFEVEQLDNTPQGRADDDLASDLDRLVSVQQNSRRISLYLEKQNQKAGPSIWLVSTDSVGKIASLSVTVERPSLEQYVPAPLVKFTFLGTPVWAWLGLVLLGVLLGLLSRALSRLAVVLVRPVTRRYFPSVTAFRMGTFVDPLRLLVGVAVFRASMEAFGPSALLREYLTGALVLLGVAGTASILMRIVDVVSDVIISKLDPAERSLSYSVIPLGVRFLKIILFGIAVLVILDQWNVKITTILAGVGVGGLAVALAAQRTIENLFGGISILTDRPVLVGDVCQFGGQTGTVIDIGLRSTRIRTSERTVVTVPNSQFSTMTLENLSKRDRMLFHPALFLRRDTPPDKVRELMQRIEAMLRERSDVDAGELPVRFLAVEPGSFKLEVFAYVLTPDGTQFLRVQSELLLRILELARSVDVRFAVPFTETIAAEMRVEV